MYTITNDKPFLQVLLDGKVYKHELLAAQFELMTHPDYTVKNSMWVFSDSFGSAFSAISIDLLIERIKTLYPPRATKEKAAMVSCSNTQNAIMQMICKKFDNASLPFKFRAFRDYAEAEAWLIT
jgi:hypothetical protein